MIKPNRKYTAQRIEPDLFADVKYESIEQRVARLRRQQPQQHVHGQSPRVAKVTIQPSQYFKRSASVESYKYLFGPSPNSTQLGIANYNYQKVDKANNPQIKKLTANSHKYKEYVANHNIDNNVNSTIRPQQQTVNKTDTPNKSNKYSQLLTQMEKYREQGLRRKAMFHHNPEFSHERVVSAKVREAVTDTKIKKIATNLLHRYS